MKARRPAANFAVRHSSKSAPLRHEEISWQWLKIVITQSRRQKKKRIRQAASALTLSNST
jgi:hypothetical protein